jgi:PII-like signaling protein
MLPTDGVLLRIFIGEADRYDKQPLYEWIITEAKARGLGGATVLRGLMGFGANSRVIHTFKIERLSEDLPIIVELVDTSEKIEAFLAHIEQHIQCGWLATTEQIRIRFYRGETTAKSRTDAQG